MESVVGVSGISVTQFKDDDGQVTLSDYFLSRMLCGTYIDDIVLDVLESIKKGDILVNRKGRIIKQDEKHIRRQIINNIYNYKTYKCGKLSRYDVVERDDGWIKLIPKFDYKTLELKK